ncbi:MAG: glycosyltransferase family 2 protein [Actinomycetota bacterium]
MAAPNGPAVYLPTIKPGEDLTKALTSLAEGTIQTRVVVIDNGWGDESLSRVGELHPRAELFRIPRNIGYGPALNRAVRERPADPVVFLNDDIQCNPRFMEALLEVASGAEMVAAVLLRGDDPTRIDSAGIVADRSVMGFDYLNGEPVESARNAPAPLGPTGGAALFRREAFEKAGGFDERMFAYYEDLDLVLRMRLAGARCRLAPEAQAIHAYSATWGPGTGKKYARSGWSRGYMLRRYRVMRSPPLALHALVCESALCCGQVVRDRTARGLLGRVRGWRDAAGLEPRATPPDCLLEPSVIRALSLRRRRRRA